MANIILKNTTTEQMIAQMETDAQYDITDFDPVVTDEGPDLGEIVSHIHAKSAPPTVPKLFLAGHCIFNCAYCGCRSSYDKTAYCHEPRELAKTAVQMAKNNGHGVFVTSAIYKNADYTEERILQTIKHMRQDEGYRGYIHAKVMPGTDPLLIRAVSRFADRMSVNIEVAKSEGYLRVAHQKNKNNILTPMQNISDIIAENKLDRTPNRGKIALSQSTQLMAGSSDEDDRTIMVLARAMYKKYGLKRIYYTSFQYRNIVEGYDLPLTATPTWRMRRLYQADRLLQLYGFSPDDVTPEISPFLDADIDPKAAFALRNLDMYPVEINKADYETLIRVPGIGLTYAMKIIEARKYCTLTHDLLKKIGVSLKRAIYFITCNGKYLGGNVMGTPTLRLKMAVDSGINGDLGTNATQRFFDKNFKPSDLPQDPFKSKFK